ncbi:MAG: Mrp/NBP35 family ATP-binding protein [Planctomycetota bacterium]
MVDAPVSEPQVLESLRVVQDPDLGRDIVALGFIKDLRICGGNVAFTIELTTPACPVKDQMKAEAEAAVGKLPGVDSVVVNLSARVAASKPSYDERPPVPGARNVIAVSSGKGGVGKSTVAVNLACALHLAGAKTGILDADLYGPNVPMMLGVSGKPEGRGDKIFPFVREGVQVMSIGLLVPEEQPVIWRGPMLHKAINQFLFDVLWDDLDYLFVDLPPGTGDAQLSLAQQAHLAGAIVVTTPQNVAVHDVRKAVRMFDTVKVPVLGVVENMAWFQPPGSGERFAIFGEGGGQRIEREFEIPLLGQLPIDLAVREGGDTGRPAVITHPDSAFSQGFRELASQVAARISTRNAQPPAAST